MMVDQTKSAGDIASLLANTPYRPLRLIGRGSMGEVWAIAHEFIGREFALKVLHRRHVDKGQLAERLRQEARAMSAIEHPNIAEVVDFWIAQDGRPCLVMELLCGTSLHRLLVQRKQLTGPEVIAIGKQALAALVAAHEIGVVHRDIKPENLFIHQLPNQPEVVKLLDFGLARVSGGPRTAVSLQPLALTRTGTILGSPRFLSPEAMNGQRVGPEGDLYSLGVVLYLCLVGLYSQFDLTTLPAFQPPSRCGARDCSPELDAIILRAVEAEQTARFATATEFLDALERLSAADNHQRLHSIAVKVPKGSP